jgi:hypothetical protein
VCVCGGGKGQVSTTKVSICPPAGDQKGLARAVPWGLLDEVLVRGPELGCSGSGSNK